MRILVIHGPNLELLGHREPAVYGNATLAEVDAAVAREAETLGVTVTTVQLAEENALVTAVRDAAGHYDGILINPAVYTHTSTALAAAFAESGVPYVEVHLSNPYGREKSRHRSYVAAGALGRVMGFGFNSYILGLRGLVAALRRENPSPSTR